MNSRVQMALDGDIDRNTLSATEHAELLEAEFALDAILRAVPVETLPEVARAVLRRIKERETNRGTIARVASTSPTGTCALVLEADIER